MSCGTCTKVRAHMPAAIRYRLELLERKMAQKRAEAQRIQFRYTVGAQQPKPRT